MEQGLERLEVAANAVMACSILLAARNSRHTWSIGIAGCALFGVVFFRSQLYADALLQLFFIATSLVGWWQWAHPGEGQAGRERPVTRSSALTLARMMVLALAVTVSYGTLLYRFTDAYQAYADSAVLALSVMAQVLLMQRKIATWPFWLAVNTVSVGLFASRGLELTAALYGAYWVNAWYGWWRWGKAMTTAGPAVESR